MSHNSTYRLVPVRKGTASVLSQALTTASVLWATAAAALPPAKAPAAPVSLGSAAGFAVLGGSTVTSVGATSLDGSLGLDPGVSVTGFPPGVLTSGAIHITDAVAQAAKADLASAFGALAGQSCGQDLSGVDLGGLTLTPGVYCFSAAAQITGTLTLDGLGDPGAIFIFQMGSTVTSSVSAAIVPIGGTQPCNVYWKVGTSATVGVGTAWVGNILAAVSITLGSGANLQGRALAQGGAVTLAANQVSAVTCAPVPPCQGAVNGTPCDDGDGCTQTDTCQASACVGANPVLCPSGGPCAMPGTCESATGLCAYPVPPCGSGTGDPHLRSFDGLYYHVMAAGEFLLVRTPELTIQVRHTRPLAHVAIAVIAAAVVQVGADTIVFSSPRQRAWINGVEGTCAPVPARLAGGTWCSRHGDVFALHSNHADVSVQLDPRWLNISVSLSSTVSAITGLLGNRDGDPKNDLMARNGGSLPVDTTIARFHDEFLASWVVPSNESLFGTDPTGVDPPPYAPPEAPATVADLAPDARAEATAVCVGAGVANPVLLEACVLDVAVSGDPAAADVFLSIPPPQAVVHLSASLAAPSSATVPGEVAVAPVATMASGCGTGAGPATGAVAVAGLAVALLQWRRNRRNARKLAVV